METSMKRSTSLAVLIAAALSGAALSACAPKPETPVAEATPTPTPEATPSLAEVTDAKKFAIGSLEAYALRDGGFTQPNDNKVLGVGKTKEEVAAVLTAAGLSGETFDLSIQPLLVKTPDHVILFDTGAGSGAGDAAGKLPISLAATDVIPASVNDIFISHAHFDHIGGLVGADGTLRFPNASIHISAPEWAALKANKEQEAVVKAITTKVVEFQPGADIIPGVVKAVEVKGHTPGHSAYLITSGDQSLLYIGDTAHHSVVSVQHPDWTIAYDGDAPTAQASRKALLDSLAASGQRVYAVHFPYPGIGKFEKQGDVVVWKPE